MRGGRRLGAEWALVAIVALAACGEDVRESPGGGVPRISLDGIEVAAPVVPDVHDLGVAAGEPAPDARVYAWLDRGVATVGEVVELTVAVNHLASLDVVFPEVRRMNRFDVLPGGGVTTEPAPDGRIVTRRVYALQAFVPGDYVVPQVPVVTIEPDGRRHRQLTDHVAMVVSSVIPAEAAPEDLIDIKDPVLVEEPLDLRPVVALGVVLVVAAAGLTFLVLRRRARDEEDGLPSGPHDIALRELDELEARGLLSLGRFDEHYLALDRIFRGYLERRYELLTRYRASEEILDVLTRHPYLGEHTCDIAERLMHQTDLVKFARHEPSPPDWQASRADLLYFIDLTRPVETAPVREAVEGEA